jgi:phosphoenolpyruvate carboxylase
MEILTGAGRALASRFDDFRRTLDRRDETAYRTALADLLARLTEWSGALDRVVVPALQRVPRRDLAHELTVDLVQLRELTRHTLKQIEERARLSDVLGLVENLGARLTAHLRQMTEVYAPAAEPVLSDADRAALVMARPPD